MIRDKAKHLKIDKIGRNDKEKMKDKQNKIIVAIMFITMLSISMSENTRGVFVPIFKASFSINDAGIGLLFFLSSCSYMLATFLAGHVIDIISRKRTMILGSILLMLGTYIIASAKMIHLFYLGFIVSNMGMGSMALAVNTIIPKLKVRNTAVMMNLVHFVYGVGATITHKTCGILLKKGLNYGQIYYILLASTSLVFIGILFTHFSEDGKKIEKQIIRKKEKVRFHKGEYTLLTLMALSLGLYIGAELQTGNWLVEYIKTAFSYSENKASNFSALFFLFFSLGRLFGGFVAEKIGYLKSVILSTATATVIYSIGLMLGSQGLILISISGIFFSIVFPTIILSVHDFFGEKLNKATGIIVTIASGTNMILGFVIGYTSKQIGIQRAMYIIPILLLISTIGVIMVHKKGHGLISRS